MATKKKNIFTRSKPLVNIYSGIDHEGKQVEVREDAEQLVKWHEISEALVAAGYYRAQLQGLSAFDKIVGGLTWCIELCDIDIDVCLLFEENLTIGKKITLTEKIVKVLPSLKCPFIIEPHQIQGLDFINIFPLVQWLIKYSSEFREAKEDELRKFAVLQYDKESIFECDRENFISQDKLLRNIKFIQNLYKPCRVRKRKGPLPVNEMDQVNSTLAEYDQRMLLHITSNQDDSKKDEGLDFLYDYEKSLADPSAITMKNERRIEQDDHIEDNTKSKIHYAVLQSELSGELSQEIEESEKFKYSENIEKSTSAINLLENELELLREEHEKRMDASKKLYTSAAEKLRKITFSLMKCDDFSDKSAKEFYKSLKDLARERNELLQVISHREMENSKLKEQLSTAKESEVRNIDEPLTASEMQEFNDREGKMKAYISNMRLELAQVNKEVLRYTMAIDEVPGTAELLQYEKRFMELYNQVASKHKETKQYYAFYNTLYEVKLYTSKELSLLNSILDNYEEAMSSQKNRSEFMAQLESIVEWVNQTVRKVELMYNQEKTQKSSLHSELSRLLDVQRQYAATLKKLAEVRQKIRSKQQ